MRGRPVAAGLVLAAALSSCAGRPAPATVAPKAAPPATVAPTAAPPALACRYAAEGPVELSPRESAALDLARTRLSPGRRPPLLSPALVRAARELAGRASRGEADPLERRSLRAALARACAFDAAPAAVLVQSAPAVLAEALAAALPRASATHLGAAVVERDGVAFLVLLASERPLSLAPFPRDVAPGQTAVLAGSLERSLRRPRIFVTRPGGSVEEIDATGVRGFRATVPFRERGRHVVEVTAEGEGGPEVAALLVVASGAASLETAAGTRGGAAPAGRAGEAAGVEASVVRAINAARGRHGLPPLRNDPAVARVALRHSVEMARAGKLAHVLRGSEDVGGRLRAAGVPYRRVYENVARAESALEAHGTVEESPAHLANLLRPEASLVGVGVATGSLPSGAPTLYLTEILVEPPDDGASSRRTPEARVRDALWGERARRRLPPLTADPALDELARESARILRDRDATETPDLGAKPLALGRNLAAVDVFVASAPDEAIRSANLLDRRFARVGVGVVRGESRRFGAGRYFIAVVYTD